MPGHQGMTLFVRIKIRRSGLVIRLEGGIMPLGLDFEVAKANAKPRVFLSQPGDQVVAACYCSSSMHGIIMIMD